MTTTPRLSLPWRLAPLSLMLVVLAGCTAPSPFGGAPVEDRTRAPVAARGRPPAPPAPGVEVTPLAPPAPLTPSEPIVGQPLPAAPVAPPARPVAPPVAAAPAAPAAPATPAAPAAPEPERGNSAVVALLDSANGYVRNNELDKAAAALERAQRLEPRNPNILYDLAQVRAHQGQYAQSEALAQKSIGLAAGNKPLQARAWRLIAAVRRAGGNAAGGDTAEAQAVTLGGR